MLLIAFSGFGSPRCYLLNSGGIEHIIGHLAPLQEELSSYASEQDILALSLQSSKSSGAFPNRRQLTIALDLGNRVLRHWDIFLI